MCAADAVARRYCVTGVITVFVVGKELTRVRVSGAPEVIFRASCNGELAPSGP